MANSDQDEIQACEAGTSTVAAASPSSATTSTAQLGMQSGSNQNLQEEDNIDEAIKTVREAVQLTSPDSPDLPMYLSCLGTIFRRRFERFGDTKDIEDAVKQGADAVGLDPIESGASAKIINDFGVSLICRFRRFGEVGDLHNAVKQHLEAVRLTPRDSRGLPMFLSNLGGSFMQRFERFGEAKDVDDAIKHHLEAVRLTPIDSHDSPMFLSHLGLSFMRRFERFGEAKDVDNAIKHQLEAVRLTPHDSRDLPLFLSNLGLSLICRFERFGEVGDLHNAVKQHLEAVRLTPLDSRDLPLFLSNLGVSFIRRFERFGEAKDVDDAIKHELEAVRLTPIDSHDSPMFLSHLGLSFMRRFERFGEAKDVDNAIKHQLEAVRLTPLDSRDLPLFLINLGVSSIQRFERFGEAKDVDNAIKHQLEAVRLTPLDSRDLPLFLSNLGVSSIRRFERFGEAKDVDDAIKHELEAVRLTPLDSHVLPMFLTNLGGSFMRRFERFGEAKDVDDSIKNQLEAVRLTPLDSRDLPTILNNLGGSFMQRFQRFGEAKDVDDSIKHRLEAVRLTPLDSRNSPMFLNNLGTSFLQRFGKFGEAKDVDNAIKHQLEAVRLTPLDSHDLPMILINLGLSFMRRFERFWEAKDVDSAIKHHLEADRVIPRDNPHLSFHLTALGNSFLSRFINTENTSDFQEAVLYLHLAVESGHSYPQDRFHASSLLACILHDTNNLVSAMAAYTQAVEILPLVAWIGLSASAQLNQLTADSQTLVCDAAACAIELAVRHSDYRQQHLGVAVELLDQGRSIMWSQASNLRTDAKDLRSRNLKLAEDLDRSARVLIQGGFSDPTHQQLTESEAQAHRRAAEEFTKLVKDVRSLSGFERFLLPPGITELQQAATRGPIVVINISRFRCDALTIRCDQDLELVPLPGVKKEETEQLADFFKRGKFTEASLGDALHTTWLLFGEPIVKALSLGCGSSLCRIWWYMTTSLTFIPIHACHPKPSKNSGSEAPDGMMDLVISSYTPTISSLLRAHRLKPPESLSILAVAQPEAIDGWNPLPCARHEVEILRSLVTPRAQQSTVLIGSEATVDVVTEALRKCTWAHFACHAFQDSEQPTKSALLMHDGHLTLARVVQFPLHDAQFAFLSACQSATGSTSLPNESVHISAGLQFAGFRSVVGTMWSIDDIDGPFVSKRFYEHLYASGTFVPHAEDTALALHLAVRQLRDHSVDLQRWVPFVHFGV